jgi:N-acetylmuramoyl-L-alanine amidase
MRRDINLIVIHCSASKETVNYTFEQCVKDHRARGFNACGYHRFISRDGTIHEGRDFYIPGAHVLGHNMNSIGICYEGGLDSKGNPKDTRTEAQKTSIMNCISDALEYADYKVKRITGHRDLSPDLNGNGVVEPDEWVKVCPCFDAGKEYMGFLDVGYKIKTK